MKRLPKHLRPRWRYLAVELETWPDADFDRRTFQQHCWWACQDLLGDVGAAAIDLSVMRFELADGAGHAVVQVRRGAVDRARAALACIDAVDDHPVGLRVRGIGGTVRACEEKYLGREAEATRQRGVVFQNVESDVVVRHGRVDVRCDDAFAGATTTDLH